MEDTPDWMKRFDKPQFARHMVPLAPGEEQPTYALEPPPSPGYRWETDAEFTDRIKRELGEQ